MPTTDDLIRKALQDRAAAVDPDALRDSHLRHDRMAGPRPPMLLAIAASIIVVGAIAAGAFAFSGGGRHAHPGSGTAQPATKSLYGVTWLDPQSRDTVRFELGTAHTDDGCLNEARAMTVSGHQLSHRAARSESCPPAAEPGLRRPDHPPTPSSSASSARTPGSSACWTPSRAGRSAVGSSPSPARRARR